MGPLGRQGRPGPRGTVEPPELPARREAAAVPGRLGRPARRALRGSSDRLARAALARLPGAELELLFGLPSRDVVQAAGPGVATRIYIPYGRGYLPYAVRHTVSHPVTAWWLARDLALRRR